MCFTYNISILQSPVFYLNAIDAIEMLLVMGNYGHTDLAPRDANHQVEVLYDLADAFQAKLLATEGFWNLIDAYNGIVVYQHLGLGYLLLAITLWSIVGSVEQFNGGDGRNAT